jgi:hypothetical protein
MRELEGEEQTNRWDLSLQLDSSSFCRPALGTAAQSFSPASLFIVRSKLKQHSGDRPIQSSQRSFSAPSSPPSPTSTLIIIFVVNVLAKEPAEAERGIASLLATSSFQFYQSYCLKNLGKKIVYGTDAT